MAFGLLGSWATSALSAARAEAQAPAGPTEGAALSIWYRSSEGCPEGAVFVQRLAELGRRATLARVGDRVDFVVTVARAANVSSGRLERQTTRGTVAIRELEAAHCDEVTEALALSLEIALEPEASDFAAGARDTRAEAAALEDALASPHDHVAAFELGAQGSLAKGMAGWAPGGAVFAALRARDEWAIAGRLSLAAAFAAETVAALQVDVLWMAARAEGCAFELRTGPLSLQPCAGAELGQLRAGSSGAAARSDRGVWSALVGLVRASLELDRRFALEAQAGAAVPLVRYVVGSSSGGELFQTEPVIIALAIGARWTP